MPEHLSDIFRFTQKMGQKGHQIGRKVGDALEIITLGMIFLDKELVRYLVTEDGLEGASTAKHKVEFSFFRLDTKGKPDKANIKNLFGFIECKKVGVEQTIKQSFKKWVGLKLNFFKSNGYPFTVRDQKILIKDESNKSPVLYVSIEANGKKTEERIKVKQGDSIAFAINIHDKFEIIRPDSFLHELEHSIQNCTIVHIEKITENRIDKILVEDCLTGPQTPEKAKQAAFVALDVRKNITGVFDKNTADKNLSSVLVIGEASHWEEKSRRMVRLCIDHLLTIPDQVIIDFFKLALEEFGEGYQDCITKAYYFKNPKLRECTETIIKKHKMRVLKRLDSAEFVRPTIEILNGKPTLKLVNI